MEAEKNTNRTFMTSSYGDEKVGKNTELNSSMSIAPQAPDEYERKINSIGGNNNG